MCVFENMQNFLPPQCKMFFTRCFPFYKHLICHCMSGYSDHTTADKVYEFVLSHCMLVLGVVLGD